MKAKRKSNLQFSKLSSDNSKISKGNSEKPAKVTVSWDQRITEKSYQLTCRVEKILQLNCKTLASEEPSEYSDSPFWKFTTWASVAQFRLIVYLMEINPKVFREKFTFTWWMIQNSKRDYEKLLKNSENFRKFRKKYYDVSFVLKNRITLKASNRNRIKIPALEYLQNVNLLKKHIKIDRQRGPVKYPQRRRGYSDKGSLASQSSINRRKTQQDFNRYSEKLNTWNTLYREIRRNFPGETKENYEIMTAKAYKRFYRLNRNVTHRSIIQFIARILKLGGHSAT